MIPHRLHTRQDLSVVGTFDADLRINDSNSHAYQKYEESGSSVQSLSQKSEVYRSGLKPGTPCVSECFAVMPLSACLRLYGSRAQLGTIKMSSADVHCKLHGRTGRPAFQTLSVI